MLVEKLKANWNPLARAAAVLGGLLWYATRDISFSYPDVGLIVSAFAGLAIGYAAEVVFARIGGLRGRKLAVSSAITLALCVIAPVWMQYGSSIVMDSGMSATSAWAGAHWYVVMVLAAAVISAYLEPAHALMLVALTGTALAAPIIEVVATYTYDPLEISSYRGGGLFVAFAIPAAALAWAAVGVFSLYVRRVVRSRQSGAAARGRLVPAAGAVAYALAVAGVVLWFMSVNLSSSVEMWKLLGNVPAARLVASELERSFDTTQLVEAGPAVQKRLLELSLPASLWAFTIVDRKTGEIVLAERIARAPDGGSETLAPRIVTLDPKSAAAIGAEVKAGKGGGFMAGPGILWADWRYAKASIGQWTTATLDVVVTDPMMDQPDYRPAWAGDYFKQLVDTHLPWLFAALLLPVGIALLVLEKREAARAELLFAQERSRLARDAHDRVYNRMTALASKIESEGVGADPAAPAAEIRGAVEDLQRILGDVDPRAAADPDSGARLLDDVIADQSDRWGLEIAVYGREELVGLDPRIAWELQCVVEEALTNAGRHAEASRVTVTAAKAAGRVRIEVADDGRGMSVPVSPGGLPENARGLRGIRDRMRAAGGTMSVTSSEHGTTVSVEVPV
jgi:signal transduction histidine kinase